MVKVKFFDNIPVKKAIIVAITFGSDTSDGNHVYVVPQDGEDVILADKKWVQEIIKNFY